MVSLNSVSSSSKLIEFKGQVVVGASDLYPS